MTGQPTSFGQKQVPAGGTGPRGGAAMAGTVARATRGRVALLTLDNPPVNALGAALRDDLAAALDAAIEDAAVGAIVIAAAGRTFPAGADIREFDAEARGIALPDLCDRIEAAPKPVIAALHGTALGGGLELALAAHVRIALASARLGFPEVKLGLLPGAGGTQRTPRLIGAEQALRLMISGQRIGAAEALAMGLIDGVVEEGLTEAAIALAADLAAEGKPPVPTRARRTGFRDPVLYARIIAAAREAPRNARLPAPDRIVDCVEAALLLPFDAGLTFERTAFADLLTSPAAKGLRHAFLAERRLRHTPEAGLAPRPVAQVGVVGGGPVGAGLLAALLGAGLRATLIEADRDALIAGLERIATLHEAEVAAGRLTPEARDADWERLAGSVDPARLAGAEAILDPGEAPQASLALADALAASLTPGAVLALGDPASPLWAAAASLGRAGDAIGLAVTEPSHVAPLVDLCPAPATAAETTATVAALLHRVGKTVLRSANGTFVLESLRAAGRRALRRAAEAGARPEVIEAALRDFGFALGARPFGALPATAVSDTPPSGERIAEGCLLALIAAGARLVAAGVALRASDVDVAATLGLGFPRWRGGPMHMADERGLLQVRNALLALAAEDADLWSPAAIFDHLIKYGERFRDLDGGKSA